MSSSSRTKAWFIDYYNTGLHCGNTEDKKPTGSSTIFILLMTNGQLKVLLNVPMTLMYLS